MDLYIYTINNNPYLCEADNICLLIEVMNGSCCDFQMPLFFYPNAAAQVMQAVLLSFLSLSQ